MRLLKLKLFFIVISLLVSCFVYAQRLPNDTLHKTYSSDITFFRIQKDSSTIWYNLVKNGYRDENYLADPEKLFDSLKVISIDEALEIIRTQKHFKDGTENCPDLFLKTDHKLSYWEFRTRSYRWRYKIFYWIDVNAETGVIERQSSHKYRRKGTVLLRHVRAK